MESPRQDQLSHRVDLPLRRGMARSSAQPAFRPVPVSRYVESDLWHDVFVQQRVPWHRFFQSAVLHAGAAAMVWMISIAWLRQQTVLTRPFDRSSVITYSPEEYLPPLDTGTPESAPKEKGDPAYSKQPIISVPPEADNRAQTIVTPPDIRLTHDVPMPNIIAMANPIPAVPLEATRSQFRTALPETAIIPPAPDVNLARRNTTPGALSADVIAPPPEIRLSHSRGAAALDSKIVEPPPSELPRSLQGTVGQINIGPSAIVAPAPELAIVAQHTFSGRGSATLGGGVPEAVAPPPSLNGSGGSRTGGRLIALGIHPAAIGPVAAPGGNRRGTFAATPEGRPGASGTPGAPGGTAGKSNGSGSGHGSGNQFATNGSLPSGLHVGAMNSAATSSGGSASDHGRAGDPTVMASASAPRVAPAKRVASPVPDDKITETDRKVFGDKRPYSMTLNMPNLNSATGSWVMRFAELKASPQQGVLLAPYAIEKSDPGYPLELMRDNVQGTVTLYAVIHSDGSVRDIRVLDSPDDRLDSYAANALSRWKFVPASKNGASVALQTVVMIPFRLKRTF